jgi:hypothetical protein
MSKVHLIFLLFGISLPMGACSSTPKSDSEKSGHAPLTLSLVEAIKARGNRP